MYKVYAGAYITICPTLSKSYITGFLYRAPPNITLPYRSTLGENVGTYMYSSVGGDPFT